jgi:DNA invertase Pin-like site-specific DNA recombinase
MTPARRRRLTAVEDTPGRVVLYTRVSAVMGRGGETFHSPALQIDAMRGLTGRLGMREVLPPDGTPVQDIDVSGRTFARGGLEVIRAMAEARQIDAVAVYDLSRLGRHVRESLNFIAELRELGVTVISTREQIDDSTQGQFMLGQYLLLAELYSNQIGDGWAGTIRRLAELGRHHGAPPLGYLRSAGALEVDPVLGPLVSRAFEDYAAGAPVAEVTRRFNAAAGRQIHRGTLKRLLANGTYLGKVKHHDDLLPGNHPALVTPQVWEAVQARRRRDGATPSRTLAVAHSLAGLVVCDRCSRGLLKLRHTRGYVLLTHPSGIEVATTCRPGGEDPDLRSRARPIVFGSPPLAAVEQEVLTQLADYARDLVADVNARGRRESARARAIAGEHRLTRNLAADRQALAQLTIDYAKRQITAEAYQAATAALQASIAAAQTRLDQTRAAAAAPLAADVVPLVERLTTLWPDMSPAERNQALRALISQIRIRPGTRVREPVTGRVTLIHP